MGQVPAHHPLEQRRRGLGLRSPERQQDVTAAFPGCFSNLAPSDPLPSPLSLAWAHSPLALHVGSSSVSVEHGIVRGPLHGFAVKLNGLCPLLASKSLIGLLFHTLQVWGQLYLGALRKQSKVRPVKGQSSPSGSLALMISISI